MGLGAPLREMCSFPATPSAKAPDQHPLMKNVIPGNSLRKILGAGASHHEVSHPKKISPRKHRVPAFTHEMCSSPATRSAEAPDACEPLHGRCSAPATRFENVPDPSASRMNCVHSRPPAPQNPRALARPLMKRARSQQFQRKRRVQAQLPS